MCISAGATRESYAIQRSAEASERVGLDAKPLQDGDEQLCQRKFFDGNLALPAGVRVDACAGLIVFVSLAEFEITAVGEAEVLTTGGNDGIFA